MSVNAFPQELRWAVEAAQQKKAGAVTVLDLRELDAFTDYFLLCTGYSAPQVRAIGEAVEQRLQESGRSAGQREGRDAAEWVLLDYGRLVVHIFSERARQYYDLERLWRAARRTDFPDAAASATGER